MKAGQRCPHTNTRRAGVEQRLECRDCGTVVDPGDPKAAAEEGPAEEWRDVVGHEGRYSVSDRGRVRSWIARGGPRLLKVQTASGSAMANMQIDGQSRQRSVCRLMLEAFDRPPVGKEIALHINGDPFDCRLENLRWGTDDDRGERDTALGFNAGERNGRAKMGPAVVRELRLRHAAGESASALSKSTGIGWDSVYAALTGETWPDAGGPVVERTQITKLNKADADAIRERHANGESLAEIAEDYPVTPGMIWHIVTGRSWTTGGKPGPKGGQP